MRGWRSRLAALFVALTATAYLSTAAKADKAVALSGVDGGAHSFYGYAGGIAALDGNIDQSGPLVRLWADYLTYEFFSGPTKVDADSVGVSVSAGYQYFHSSGVVSGFLGVETRNTVLSPDVSAATKGVRTGARMEVDAIQRLTQDLTADAIGSFLTNTNDYWTRARLLYKAHDSFALGPETIWQGNAVYNAYRIGAAFVGGPIFGSVTVTIDAGYEKNENLSPGGYAGLSVGVTF